MLLEFSITVSLRTLLTSPNEFFAVIVTSKSPEAFVLPENFPAVLSLIPLGSPVA